MNQLWATQTSINDVARKAYGGVAAATALTMIPEVDPGKRIAIGIGAANYQGYGATALGASVRVTDSFKVKLGVSVGPAGAAYGGGMSYQF
jgi:autotransporter adhesin